VYLAKLAEQAERYDEMVKARERCPLPACAPGGR